MKPGGNAPAVDAVVDGVTPFTAVWAPGLASGFCGRGMAGWVPPTAPVPELRCAIPCAAACAAWVGPVVPPGVVTAAPSSGGGIGPPAGTAGPTAPNLAG